MIIIIWNNSHRVTHSTVSNNMIKIIIIISVKIVKHKVIKDGTLKGYMLYILPTAQMSVNKFAIKEALEQQFLPINENQWSRHFNRSSGSVSHKLSWPQKNWLVQISCRSSGQIQPPLCHQDIHCWVHVRTPYFNSTALQPRFRELFISKRNFYPWIWWKLKHWCKLPKIL